MTKEDLIEILAPKNQHTERKFFNKVKNAVSAIYDMIAGTVTPLADDIIEDSTHRFVTDVQIADWDLKEDSANKGTASGYAELDETGRVPVAQLPAFVDEVIEAANAAALPATGAASAIYVTLDDNKTFRWGGTAYVEISATIALGELSTTAYRGDRGKTAYDHSQVTHDKALVGLANVDNTSDMDKPVSTAQQAAIDLAGGAGVASIDDLNDAKTGGFSTFLGTDAGAADDGSDNMNVAVGGNALKSCVSGNSNVAVGFRAAESTTGTGNVALGLYALLDNEGGGYNVAVGWNALSNSLNNDNAAIGYSALSSAVTSSKNVGVGRNAGRYLEDGNGRNVYVGYYSSASGVEAENEIAIGAGTTGKGDNTSVVGDANQTDFYAGQNGQSVIHGKSIQTTLIESASLSNPPTLAELSAALGSPGFIGSGHEVNVFDTINSIMYNCNTDGTDWYYVVKTKAL